ncbi:hypothetical protein Tco_0716608 [Tanacetum coccineum]
MQLVLSGGSTCRVEAGDLYYVISDYRSVEIVTESYTSYESDNALLVHQVLDTAYASRMIRRIGCQNQ